jgi:hypothetical protein
MIVALLGLLLRAGIQDTSDFVLTDHPRYTVRQFRRLTVPARLRIYNTLYDRSGHPRNVGLAFGFGDQPAETLRHVVADLPPGDFGRFLRYMPIVQTLAQVRRFDICRTAEFPVLRSRLRSYRLYREQREALGNLGIRNCSLF